MQPNADVLLWQARGFVGKVADVLVKVEEVVGQIDGVFDIIDKVLGATDSVREWMDKMQIGNLATSLGGAIEKAIDNPACEEPYDFPGAACANPPPTPPVAAAHD